MSGIVAHHSARKDVYRMRPGDFSALHRLGGPELWHHYAGASVQMLLLEPGSAVGWDPDELAAAYRSGRRHRPLHPEPAVTGATGAAGEPTSAELLGSEAVSSP